MAYNLFAQQKQQNYPNAQTAQQVNPGQGNAGETPGQFAAGKQAANSQGAGYIVQPVQQPQQPVQPTVTNTARPAATTTRAQNTMPAIDPSSPTAGMDALSQMYTSPEEEERMRKASVANQRIMAVGEAIRHLGNIFHTVNYAPAQQLTNSVSEEQQRYEKGKALRDAANYKYLTYQQQRAAQEAKQRQWDADFNLKVADAARKAGYTEAQIQNMRDRLANQRAYQEGSLALRERLGTAQQKERERHNKVAERQGQQRIGIASQNARNMQAYRQWKMNGGGGGNGSGGVAPLDTPKGRITPNGRNYSNQIEQIWSFAKDKGLVEESDVEKQLRTLGLGKDKSADVRHQMVLDLLRTNQSIGDYAADRLGWSYGGGTNMDLGLEDDEDEMDLGLE